MTDASSRYSTRLTRFVSQPTVRSRLVRQGEAEVPFHINLVLLDQSLLQLQDVDKGLRDIDLVERLLCFRFVVYRHLFCVNLV